MLKIIAKTLSYLFHPLIITTWFVLLLLYTNPFSFAGLSSGVVIAVVFINTFMFPAISILLMRKLDFINDLEMLDNKERIIPMIATIVFYVWAYLATRKINFPYMMGVFMIGTLVSLFASFMINIFYKISLHVVAISGVLTATLMLVFISPSDMSYWFLSVILLTGAIASARLYLNSHTLKEVYIGFLVGVFGQVFGLFLFH